MILLMRFNKLIDAAIHPDMMQRLGLHMLVYGCALLTAVVLGYWIGVGEQQYLLIAGAFALAVLVAVWLQRRAWILIVLGWLVTGQFNPVSSYFPVQHLAVMMAVAAMIGYYALTKTDLRQPLKVLDWIVLLNFFWLAITFVVNPVGSDRFGAETIGGRPYMNAAFALVAYWVIVRLPDAIKPISKIPVYLAIGPFVIGLINVTAYVLPALAPVMMYYYSEVDLTMYVVGGATGKDMVRLTGIGYAAVPLLWALCAYHSPRKLLNPARPWFYLLLLAIVAILFSGFRSVFVQVFPAFAFSALFHRGWREMVLAAGLGGLLLTGVIIGQGRLYQLPPPAQRALCFLPGNWSEAAVMDAEISNEGRFKWWRDVIQQRLIHNWWVGDGFGVKKEDLYGRNLTETVMNLGVYHNGPLSTIRYVGIVGLALFYCLMFMAAYYAWRIVRQCQHTILLPLAIYLASQLLWWPIHYTFIYGGYHKDLSLFVFLAGLLRLTIRLTETEPLPNPVSQP